MGCLFGFLSFFFLREEQKSASKPKDSSRSSGQNKPNHKDDKINKNQINPNTPQIGGLKNIGSTCYLNSALQCLFQTHQLSLLQFYTNQKFIKEYLKLKESMIQSSSSSPRMVKEHIQKYNSLFKGMKQQDAGEVLNTMLNMFKDQTNSVKNDERIKINLLSQQSDFILWKEYVKKDHNRCKSILDDIFVGRYKTTYKCQTCQKQKRLFQSFTTVYLPIPTPQNNKTITFQECLQDFQNTDRVQWRCQFCKKDESHLKSMQIYETNKILIFCLKRFTQEYKKIDNKIQIDQQIRLESRIAGSNQSQIGHQYQLYSMIIHLGRFEFGHYIAYCKTKEGKWFKFNDEYVQKAQIEEVSNKLKHAYIVFYKLKQNTTQSDIK